MTDQRFGRGTSYRTAVVHSFYSSAQSSGENRVVDLQVDALRRAGQLVALVAQRTDDLQKSRTYPLRAAATVATGLGPSPLRELQQFQPDVTVVHNLFPNFGRKWVNHWNGPLVAVMHNYRPMCAAAVFYRDGHACTDCLDDLSARPALRHACYRGSRAATLPVATGVRFGDDPLLRRADRIIVLNETMRRLYARAGVDQEKLRLVPNFLPDPPPTGAGGSRWLYVGRLSDEKGIVPLLQRWPADAPLDVVGTGPLAEEVRAAAPGSVVLHGSIPAEQVATMMQQARGLVFPSRWFEGFPLVYAEALAAGTPVLAWEPSAVAGLVREEGTGLVVDGDLSAALARAVDVFPSIRERCRAVFDDRYTEAVWLSAVRQVCDEATDHFQGDNAL